MVYKTDYHFDWVEVNWEKEEDQVPTQFQLKYFYGEMLFPTINPTPKPNPILQNDHFPSWINKQHAHS